MDRHGCPPHSLANLFQPSPIADTFHAFTVGRLSNDRLPAKAGLLSFGIDSERKACVESIRRSQRTRGTVTTISAKPADNLTNEDWDCDEEAHLDRMRIALMTRRDPGPGLHFLEKVAYSENCENNLGVCWDALWLCGSETIA